MCIQLFKVIKFTSALIPKMALAEDTMRRCALELFWFGFIVLNTIAAFSCTLYVQLGPQMVGFYDQVQIAISRLPCPSLASPHPR